MNGAVSCFTGSHIALALLSALVLLVAGALIPVSVLISTGKVQKVKMCGVLCGMFMDVHCEQFPKSVRSFYQPLTVAYRVSCRWWSAVELARRLLFLLVVVELPDNKVKVDCLTLLYFTACLFSGDSSAAPSPLHNNLHVCSTLQIEISQHDRGSSQSELSPTSNSECYDFLP